VASLNWEVRNYFYAGTDRLAKKKKKSLYWKGVNVANAKYKIFQSFSEYAHLRIFQAVTIMDVFYPRHSIQTGSYALGTGVNRPGREGDRLSPSNVVRVRQLFLYFIFILAEHHTTKAYWVSGGIAPRILDLGTRWRWVVSLRPQPLHLQGKRPWYPLDRRLAEVKNAWEYNSTPQYFFMALHLSTRTLHLPLPITWDVIFHIIKLGEGVSNNG
jgi:hypothetical protein